MIVATARRVAMLVAVLLLVSFGTFAMVELVPGDAASQVLGEGSTPDDYVRVRGELGLDEPFLERYVDWTAGAVRGDFGQNLVAPIGDVRDTVLRALPVNIELAVLALLISLGTAVPLALVTAQAPGGRLDRAVSAATFGLLSLPSFVTALVLLLLFAISWQLFPIGQWARPTEHGWGENLHHALLPALALAIPEMAISTRLLRRDLGVTLQEDYIAVARAKGMPRRHVLLREALRPSCFSLLTLAGISVGRVIGGSIIVERVFSLPGIGSVVVDGAQKSDFPVVQVGVLFVAVIYVVLNASVDAAYALLDPRVRRGHA